jgi:hypothetical protein
VHKSEKNQETELKRWLPFLIVNIIVSAATTLLVLTIWNRVNTANSIVPEYPPASAPDSPEQPVWGELPPLDTPVIAIANVFAADDLQNELLIVERIGEGELNLSGWQIIDQDKNAFVFPSIDLVKGQISVYSRPGTNTVNTLFWGSDEPIWSAGEIARIFDSAGQERAVFEIP